MISRYLRICRREDVDAFSLLEQLIAKGEIDMNE